ncbi:MAG: insulinase family protein, partial [Firmicutes bacterium]|nr:insulinase family protein [Bacillota bacterium]
KAEFTPHFAAGLPEDIPNAGYDELLAYHKKHYTGANCLAFVYGKCDKEPYLALLDKYFTNGGKITQDLTDKSACIKEKYIKERKYIPLPNDVEMALFPVCETKDYVKTHIYSLIAKTLEKRLDGLKVSFDDTGDVAYIKITGRGVDARKISAAAKNMTVDADSLRFYIENGDFGYKPRGLYYGMRLMYSDGDSGSLDFEKIFDKIKTEDIEALAASAFENNGIFGIKGGSLPKTPIYNTGDTKPLEEYQSKKENGGIIPLIVPEKQPFEPAAEQRGGILFTPADGDIIYLTLAFGLDIPPKLLEYTGKLVRDYSVGLPLFSMELCDLGSPCLVMNAGFFADKADEAAREINRIFRVDDGICSINFDTAPERLTDLTALGGIERNACILKNAVRHIGEETSVPQDLREILYTRENMRAAVCCSQGNFAAAEHIIGSLELFDVVLEDKTVFVPDFAPEIIKKNVNVYTISLAFKHSGSFAAAYAAAEIMKTTLLWQKVRGAGAYGSTAYNTPSGSFCINSFKDINFEKTVDTFFECIDIMRTFAHDEEEMKRYRLLCLNSAD